jgi:hypothetical protein
MGGFGYEKSSVGGLAINNANLREADQLGPHPLSFPSTGREMTDWMVGEVERPLIIKMPERQN